MDLRVIKYFLVVVKEGNISRAAQNLNITQPTLSRQLINLEKDLGTKLFTRGKREITLTEAGVIFYQRAQEIVELTEKIHDEFCRDGQNLEGNIKIGFVETCGSEKLSDFISGFHEKFPKVTFEIINGDSEQILNKLDKGLLDLACISKEAEYGNYESIVLPEKERWGLLVNAQDPITKKRAISVEDLKSRPLGIPKRPVLYRDVMEWFGEDENLNILSKYSLAANTVYLVKNGVIDVITLEGSLGYQGIEDVVFIPIWPEKSIDNLIVWKRNKIWSSVVSVFLDEAKDYFNPNLELSHSLI